MIRTQHECQVEYREHMRDGEGTVQITNFITGPAELNEKGRLFAKITLNPGCSIGFHMHENESELFYVMKGEAVYNDNGTEVPVSAGDVMICPSGSGHAVANNSAETTELCAVILYA